MSDERRAGALRVAIRKLDSAARFPEYATEGAAGADLRARLDTPIELPPGGSARIPTGLAIELPRGYEGQVRPRSGLAFKHGVTVLNAPGTIDEDYRGEVAVLLVNLGSGTFTVNDGERIAQLVVAPVVRSDFVESAELSGTSRGEGGFGSTGS